MSHCAAEPLTHDELDRYTQGHCHALALAVSAELDRRAVPHRLAVLYVDAAATVADAAVGDADAEVGDGATPANTQHVFVVTDTGACVDVVGWCPSLHEFLNYAYAGVLGDFHSADDPMLRYMWVDAGWVRRLAQTPGWEPLDLETAAGAARAALTRTNPWPEHPEPVDAPTS